MRQRIIALTTASAIAAIGLVIALQSATGRAQQGRGALTGRVTVRQGGQPRADGSQVIVYVSTPGQDSAPPAGHGEVRQRDLRFTPELVAIPRGGSIDFPNEDRVFHNVFSLSRTKRFDLGLYQAGESRTVAFNRAGVVDVYCNIHPDMVAQIYVLDTAHFALTTSEGEFMIPDVPAGTWSAVAQPRWGQSATQQVTIRPGATTRFDVAVDIGERPLSHTRKDGSPYGRYR